MQAIAFWQLVTVVAVATLMVFVGILMNRQDSNRLDEKFDKRFDWLASQLHNDLMMIHSILRDHEGVSAG
jgi:low affinity Fe/Cu permease